MAELKGETMDIAQENLERLKVLFPDVFVEGKVDFDKLRQVLGDYAEEGRENYSFVWNGKGQALKLAQTPTAGTLRPCIEESKDWDTTQNIYIEGDNLEVLKLLQKSYFNKVKMIYIDPPYNTGKDFVYKDNFHNSIQNYKEITGQVDSEGNKFSTNSETSGRYHTDWLNMMYPRLRLARNLLTEDGVIFISIDDNEVANLKKVCDEIFGEDNFVFNLIWQRAFSPKNDAKFVSNSHDYILCYAKNINNFEIGRLPRSEEANARYSNPDNDVRGAWSSSDLSVKTYSENYDYSITLPSGRVITPPSGGCWRLSKESFDDKVKDNRIWFGEDGNSTPRLKRFLSELKKDGMTPTSILFHKEVGHNQEATQEVISLFNNSAFFEGPKPVRLINHLMTLANLNNKDIVLDFFSGSATTAHAVFKSNVSIGKSNTFILVQLPELLEEKSKSYKAGYKNICEIGKERIRRAGEKIKAEKGLLAEGLDIGFKVFKLDSSNIMKWQPKEEIQDLKSLKQQLMAMGQVISTDRSELDVVYEIMLKMGYVLTSSIEELIFAGKKVYSICAGALFVCLAHNITLEIAKEIISHIYIYRFKRLPDCI